MSFSHWYVLFFLFVPALLLAWVWTRHDRRVVLPLDHGRQRRGLFWHALINLMLSAPPLILAVAIILLAGPQHMSVPKAKRDVTNIEFCLDLSGSMTAPFGEETRYDAAMASINEFIEFRQGDAYGLTIFGDKAAQWIPLTTDASAFRCATPFLHPRQMPSGFGGGTMIGLALRHCNTTLGARKEGDRMIILVSDGASFDLSGGEDEKIARELADNGVVLFAVHIGGGQVPPEVSSIANITGGATFSPGDEQALAAVFRRIDQMQVTRMSRSYAELLDFFWPFAISGLSLLSAIVLSAFGLRYTPW
jgi:Ca-activated chloride channel family protein